MGMHYATKRAERDPHSLPNIEVFQMTAAEVAESAAYQDEHYDYMKRAEFRLASMNSRVRERMIETMIEELQISGGWFYWYCLPGCMPDSDPFGPFDTHTEALQAARDDDDNNDDDDDNDDDESED